MAYDKALKEKVDAMPLGDLVHLMLTEYQRGHEDHGPYMQSQAYFWAAERLNMLVPGENMDEVIAMAEDAAYAAKHGF